MKVKAVLVKVYRTYKCGWLIKKQLFTQILIQKYEYHAQNVLKF